MAAFNPQRYETIYGVGLFDDLHNYLPELLYDTGLFTVEQQLVGFLQRRIQTLFEAEYVRNRTLYRLFQQSRRRDQIPQRPQQVQPQPTATPSEMPTTDLFSFVQQQLDPRMPPERPQRILRSPPPQIHQQRPIRSVAIDLGARFPAATLLSAWLQPDLTELSELLQNLEPVQVAPTAEQIATATILTQVEPGPDVVCAICLDRSPPNPRGETEWRYIRHCNHGFHRTCIDNWFSQNIRCPVCRHDIREEN